jgi:prephenate dehydratase
VAAAVKALGETASSLKVLGSYPRCEF